jgi:hypothetical protein
MKPKEDISKKIGDSLSNEASTFVVCKIWASTSQDLWRASLVPGLMAACDMVACRRVVAGADFPTTVSQSAEDAGWVPSTSKSTGSYRNVSVRSTIVPLTDDIKANTTSLSIEGAHYDKDVARGARQLGIEWYCDNVISPYTRLILTMPGQGLMLSSSLRIIPNWRSTLDSKIDELIRTVAAAAPISSATIEIVDGSLDNRGRLATYPQIHTPSIQRSVSGQLMALENRYNKGEWLEHVAHGMVLGRTLLKRAGGIDKLLSVVATMNCGLQHDVDYFRQCCQIEELGNGAVLIKPCRYRELIENWPFDATHNLDLHTTLGSHQLMYFHGALRKLGILL